MLAHHAAQARRKLKRGSGSARQGFDGLPYFIHQAQVLNILGDIIQPPEQAEGIAHGREGCCAQAGSHTQPGLAIDLDRYAIIDFLNVDRKGCIPASPCGLACAYLNRDRLAVAELLCAQVGAVKARCEGTSDIVRGKISMKNPRFHPTYSKSVLNQDRL
jgi:hypothetical protein